MPPLQIGRVAAERSLESLQQQVEHLTNELGSAQVGGGGGRAMGQLRRILRWQVADPRMQRIGSQ